MLEGSKRPVVMRCYCIECEAEAVGAQGVLRFPLLEMVRRCHEF